MCMCTGGTSKGFVANERGIVIFKYARVHDSMLRMYRYAACIVYQSYTVHEPCLNRCVCVYSGNGLSDWRGV